MDKTLEKEAMKKILTNSIEKKAIIKKTGSFITKFYFIKSNNYKLKNR